MNWVIKCKSEPKWRKFSRAILGKYGIKISPSVYLISNQSSLNSCLEEIRWANNQGCDIKVLFANTLQYNSFMVGCEVGSDRLAILDKVCSQM